MVTRIPLTNDPNQNFTATISGDKSNFELGFTLSWNKFAGYWTMGLYDPTSGNQIIGGIPLLPGENLIGQYRYKNIGDFAAIINIGDQSVETPDDTNLADNFALCWLWEEK